MFAWSLLTVVKHYSLERTSLADQPWALIARPECHVHFVPSGLSKQDNE